MLSNRVNLLSTHPPPLKRFNEVRIIKLVAFDVGNLKKNIFFSLPPNFVNGHVIYRIRISVYRWALINIWKIICDQITIGTNQLSLNYQINILLKMRTFSAHSRGC